MGAGFSKINKFLRDVIIISQIEKEKESAYLEPNEKINFLRDIDCQCITFEY